MLYYWGWVVAAFLAGILVSGWLRLRKPRLRQKADGMAVFAGRTLAEILKELGAPASAVPDADGHMLRTWREKGYSISLLFDAKDLCLGVMEEKEGM